METLHRQAQMWQSLKKINNQQKYAKCRANNKEIFSHSRDLLKLDKISNSYQLNILNVTTFMHTV